jgi:hypothetical protein
VEHVAQADSLPHLRHNRKLATSRGAAKDRPGGLSHIGIDFGTTNSSIALASGGSNVELVRFAQSGGATEAFRSLLYLEQVKAHGRASIKSWTGPGCTSQNGRNVGRLVFWLLFLRRCMP